VVYERVASVASVSAEEVKEIAERLSDDHVLWKRGGRRITLPKTQRRELRSQRPGLNEEVPGLKAKRIVRFAGGRVRPTIPRF
jgi:hypothetical protein